MIAGELAPEDAQFREELRDWLADHLVGEFRTARGLGGPADDRAWDVRLAWEKELGGGSLAQRRVAGGVRRPGRHPDAGADLPHRARRRRGARTGSACRVATCSGRRCSSSAPTEQKQRFLPPIARCEELWGQGFSEPDAGSDLAGLKTRAERDGDEWVITGQKIWTTFGDHADWLYVLCRTNPDAPKHRGISMLLVPRHQAGVDVRPIRNMAGGLEFCEVFLDGARTAVDNVVGEVDGGWKVVMGTLGNERAGATVLPFQAMFEREMRALLDLVRARGRRSRSSACASGWPGRGRGLRILQLNNDRLLSTVLQGGHPGPESSIGKLYWANWHRDFGELMIDVLGAEALIAHESGPPHAMQHSFLNSRAETIYGGANEIQRNILGERVLGLPKE